MDEWDGSMEVKDKLGRGVASVAFGWYRFFPHDRCADMIVGSARYVYVYLLLYNAVSYMSIFTCPPQIHLLVEVDQCSYTSVLLCNSAQTSSLIVPLVQFRYTPCSSLTSPSRSKNLPRLLTASSSRGASVSSFGS